MSHVSNNISAIFGKILKKDSSRPMPRSTTRTILYNLEHDCIISVSSDKRAIQLMREYITLHLQQNIFTVSMKNSEFIESEDWMLYGMTTDYLEVEDPRGHTNHPIVSFNRKNDKTAIRDIIACYPIIHLAKQLISDCHILSDLEQHKELNCLCIDTIEKSFSDDVQLNQLISRQRQYNKEVVAEDYQTLSQRCFSLDITPGNIYEEISTLQRFKINR